MEAQKQVPESETRPRVGPGRFQWSAGPWFGAFFGGTAWLLLGTFMLASRSMDLAWTWGACGAFSVAVGFWLWSQRSRMLPYPALMVLILTQWIAACVAIVGLVVLAPRSDLPFEANTGQAIFGLLVFPVVMLQLTLLERSNKPKPQEP